MAATTAAEVANDFRAGVVFGRSVSVFIRHIVKFMVLGIAMWLPVFLHTLIGKVAGRHMSPDRAIPALLASFASLLLLAVCEPVIVYGAFQALRGRGFRLDQVFSRAFRRYFSIVGAIVLMGFALIIGFIVLVVPGLFFWTAFFVAIPACVVERLSPLQCLGRSADLTTGYRWQVFGLLVILILVSVVLGFVERGATAMIGGVGALAINAAIQAAYVTFQLTTHAVAYHDLRVAKEGIDIEQLASVFD